ncbi:hypothetical protein PSTT_08695 [Puccinia striiformis]|uniref:Uncharacterized protein n=1 Tax=Puccinia striiformis TaxID=27350 RepID=A0A2S4VBE0_9BASI|nr:hypothetical protein PSTT_08695 [Puccinia striiformis]
MAPHWKTRSCLQKDQDNVVAIEQEDPVPRFVFISLPTFCQAVGDNVNSDLRKMMLVLANTRTASKQQKLPNWVNTHGPASSFNCFTPEEQHTIRDWDCLELNYLSSHQQEVSVMTVQGRGDWFLGFWVLMSKLLDGEQRLIPILPPLMGGTCDMSVIYNTGPPLHHMGS